MRTIIAGSRDVTDIAYVVWAIKAAGWEPTVVISGAARGVDRLGEQWAECVGVPVELFPADWATYGKAAGHLRNAEMADNAEALIAIWDGKSPGTKGMIQIATRKGLKVFIYRTDLIDENHTLQH